jgi:hypothetical protein
MPSAACPIMWKWNYLSGFGRGVDGCLSSVKKPPNRARSAHPTDHGVCPYAPMRQDLAHEAGTDWCDLRLFSDPCDHAVGRGTFRATVLPVSRRGMMAYAREFQLGNLPIMNHSSPDAEIEGHRTDFCTILEMHFCQW